MKNFAEINRASTGAKKNFNFFEKLWEHGRTLKRVGLVLVMCLIAIPQMEANGYYLANGYWGQVDIYFNDHTTNCNVGETGDDQDWGADPVTLLTLTGFRVNVYQASENQISWSQMYYRFYKLGSTPPSYSCTNNAGWKSNNGSNNGWWENSQHQTWELTNQDIYLVTPTTESGYYYFDFYFNTDDVGYLSNNSTQYRIYFTVADRVLATNYTADGGSSWSNSERTLSDGSYTIYNVAASTDIDFKMALSGSWYNAFGWDNVGGNTGVGNLTLKSAGSYNNIRVTTPSGYRSDVTFTYSGSTVSVSATPHVYSITYKDGGDKSFTGAHMPDYPTTHTSGTATTLKKASKAGYVFDGWYTSSDCSTGLVTSLGATAYTSNITLYAKWTAVSLTAMANNTLYKVEDMVPDGVALTSSGCYRAGVSANNMFDLLGSGTADADGGPMENKDKEDGADATISGTSFNNSLYFKGAAASATAGGSTAPTSRAIHFKVPGTGQLEIWCKGPKTIYLQKSGNSSVQLDDSKTGSQLITKDVTAGEYYLYATAGSTTLFGLRFKYTYTVSIASNNDDYGSVDVTSIAKVPYGTAISTDDDELTINGTTVTATPTTAGAEYTYAFSNWTKGDGTALPSTVTSALSIRANFTRTANNYTLTWTTDGDDLTGDYTSGTVAYGAAITAPNTPTKTGYTFSAWSPSPAATMPAANTEYTAIWTAKTTTITLDPNTANHGSGDETEAVATYGATSLTSVSHTTPEAGYQLKGYYTAKTDGTKIINADGSFVTANTDYTTSGGAWKYTTSTATLYAQYEAMTPCYEFEPGYTSGSLSDYDIVATSDGGIMEYAPSGSGSTLTYTSTGLELGASSTCAVRVALENNMKAGTVITAKLYYTGTSKDRTLYLRDGSTNSTNRDTWSFTADGEDHTYTYTVKADDGLIGTNTFRIVRKNNVMIKSLKVSNCGSAATTYNMTHTLSHVTKSSGASGDGSIYAGANYTAVFSDDTGYDLPSTITVTIGGESATANTDYYWTQATGKLVIPGAKVTGNIAVTITGVAECTPHGLAYATGSVTKTLCDGTYKNTLTNGNSLSVSYSSSKTGVATVDSDGEVTLVGAGTTTIKATFAGDATYCAGNASYTLTVNASTAAGLAYGTSTVKKDVGDDAFTNTLTNTHSLSVTYSSSNEDVATIDSDGEVTIKAAGTTIITASSAQQKISSTCYAAGSATYSLTVYNVYTVTYDATDGTCGTESANTVTGEVTLPTPSHASYSFDGWYTTAGVKAGNAGAKYSPSGNITLYAKWSGSCAGGESADVSMFDGAVDTYKPTKSDRYDKTYKNALTDDYYVNAATGFKYKCTGLKDAIIDITDPTDYTDRGSYTHAVQMNGSGTSNYIELVVPSGYTAELFVAYAASSTNQKFGVNTSTATPTGDNCDTWNATNSSSNTVYTATIDLSANTTYYLSGSGSSCYFAEIKISVTPSSGSCYTVTYNGNGATGGYVSDPAQYESGTTVYAYDAAGSYTRTGYEFNGWNTKADGSGTKLSYFTITRDTTLYAQWRIVISSDNTNFEGKDTPTAYKDVKVTNGATLTITNATTMRDVTVTNGATLKIQKGTTVHDITVETGSTLNIAKDGESGVTLTANSLALKGGWDEYKENYDMPRVYIDPKSTLTKTVDVINFDISVDYRNYYPFALPFDVTINDESNVVDYAESYIAAASTYGTHYAICEYDGEKRAEGKAAWKYVPDGTTLKAGKGYILYAKTVGGKGIIRFPLNMPSAWTTLGEQGSYSAVTKNEVEVTAWGWDEEANDWKEGVPDSRKGWNLLGVPFMSCFDARDASHNEDVEGDAYIKGKLDFSTNEYDAKDNNIYVTVPVHDFSEYIQSPIDEAVLLPGWCFFIQVAKSGTLTFAQAGQEDDDNLPIYAPKREQENMPTLKTGIILTGNGAKDKTNFLISDKYSASEYEFNADLEKMFGENSFTLATYSLSGETRLAYNALSNADAANIIPIGYRAPADGEYTFSINPRYAENGAFEHVNLIDYETGIMTDLLMGSYTFSTERTQLDTRFALNVVPRQNTPTDIETVGGEGINDANAPRKVLINDKMYIIVDGKMYDATGKAVK